jgi:hypothetical protein
VYLVIDVSAFVFASPSTIASNASINAASNASPARL